MMDFGGVELHDGDVGFIKALRDTWHVYNKTDERIFSVTGVAA